MEGREGIVVVVSSSSSVIVGLFWRGILNT